MSKPSNVEEYLDRQQTWNKELTRLVEILRSTGMEEAIKWGVPVFSYHGKNVVGLSGFKSYFGLWFYQGALLKDEHQVLINAQEGKTRAMRQWRMTKASEIKVTWIKSLVKESKKWVDQGVEIKPQRASKWVMPEPLEMALKKDRAAQTAFQALTPGCQREYASYIAEAKRAETKVRRIEKILPMIRERKGLNDRYKNC